MMEETRTYSYKVAGLTFSVIAPVGIDIEALLPSFKDFRATSGGDVRAGAAPGAAPPHTTGGSH